MVRTSIGRGSRKKRAATKLLTTAVVLWFMYRRRQATEEYPFPPSLGSLVGWLTAAPRALAGWARALFERGDGGHVGVGVRVRGLVRERGVERRVRPGEVPAVLVDQA